MLIDIGPVTMFIKAKKGDKEYEFEEQKINAYVIELLSQLSSALPILKQPAFKIKKLSVLPEVAKRMVEAAKEVNEEKLTPMAAVAGAIAEMVVQEFDNEGLDFIFANNGGDIALINKIDQPFSIKIADINNKCVFPFFLKIKEKGEKGIATSGLGGRSFTLGIADVVTVCAKKASIADAAATYIASSTYVESDKIIRKKAKEIDPLTDIPDELVVVKRAKLTEKEIVTAIERGVKVANELLCLNIIEGFLILVEDHLYFESVGNLTMEVKDGNKRGKDKKNRNHN